MSTRRAVVAGECTAGVHGDLYAYRHHGCRCPAARRARGEAAAQTRRAHGVRPPPPTVRAERYVAMLEELHADHTYQDLADRLGWSDSRLSSLLRARRIQRPTAERIAELYALLRGRETPAAWARGPVRHSVRWGADDADLVEIAAGGGVPWSQLNERQRAEVVQLLRTEGLSAAMSGVRLGVSARTVARWRAAGRRMGLAEGRAVESAARTSRESTKE